MRGMTLGLLLRHSARSRAIQDLNRSAVILDAATARSMTGDARCPQARFVMADIDTGVLYA